MQIEQQAGLAHTLKFLIVDMCCFTETRLQDSLTVVILTSVNLRTKLTSYISSDTKAAAASLAGVGIALSDKAEAS